MTLEPYLGRRQLNELYYITHIDNVSSILTRGILSHSRIVSEKVPFTPIYNAEIVSSRRNRKTPDGKSLWDYANLYFQPRNAMLYQVICTRDHEEIALIAADRNLTSRPNVFVSTGNAASLTSDIVKPSATIINRILKQVDKVYWTDPDGSKRKLMAECLVPDGVPPEHIQRIYVSTHQAMEKLRSEIDRSNLPITPEPDWFFQPFRKRDLTDYLSLVEGDMFFSRLQTLTVSVNCVGVMGKGLASRAKWQFPDVYVFYQDLCRKRKLSLGKPYIYKRETSFDLQLADDPNSLPNPNAETWFILFPTKHHWRDQADIRGIEEGLRWIVSGVREMGLKSLALPALGCGLGRLEWKDVGPLMCRYLSKLEFPVWIYLPAEKEIPVQFLTKEYLLHQ